MLISKKVVRVCLCYAHEDEPLLPKLLEHLQSFQQQGLITYWRECDIQAGGEREEEIFYQIDSADIIISLISPAYIAQYYDQKMKNAVLNHHSRRCILVPVILRPVYYERTSFAHIRPLPKNEVAVTQWANQDKAFFEIAEGIRAIVEGIGALPEICVSCNSCERLLPPRSVCCNFCGTLVLQQEEFTECGDSQPHGETKRRSVPISRKHLASRRSSAKLLFPLIECLFPFFEWLLSHLLLAVLFLIIGGVALEIIVSACVSSHFAAITYIPLDDLSVPVKAEDISSLSQENIWPSAATSLIFLTNIVVTFLLLVATLLIHTYCHRMKYMLRAYICVCYAVLLLIVGFILNPLAILDAAVPSQPFTVGMLPGTATFFHCATGLLILFVLLFSLHSSPQVGQVKRSRRTTREGID